MKHTTQCAFLFSVIGLGVWSIEARAGAYQTELAAAPETILVAAPASSGWTPIDCAQSKISIPNMDKCYRGPEIRATNSANNNKSYDNLGCGFDVNGAVSERKDEESRVYAQIVDRAKGAGCYVRNAPDYASKIQNLKPIVRMSPSNWSSVQKIAGTPGMYFDTPQKKCFAFYKTGPEWKSGLLYSVYGFVCGDNNHGPITQNAITNFLAGIKVQEE